MKDYIIADDWRIVEDQYDPMLHPNTESLMSLGNGRMGQRANYPETYSGESLQGNYIAGVYYPDKTRVGWWKNGYPEYFAKILNAVDWVRLQVTIDGEEVDLATAEFIHYSRTLDMRHGVLMRDITIKTTAGKEVQIIAERFYSITNQEMCYLRYKIITKSDPIEISITSFLDFNILNADANYDEDFWTNRSEGVDDQSIWTSAHTSKTDFVVSAGAKHFFSLADHPIAAVKTTSQSGEASIYFEGKVSPGEACTLTKCVAITSSFYHPKEAVLYKAKEHLVSVNKGSYDVARAAQSDAWGARWDRCDIRIEGDTKAQQGIRFNIFQLYQTYSGEDARLNSGSTYWDTEAYCLPFYLGTTSPDVAKNLLTYRYNHLSKAIENAAKLGFTDGAALYPMVTINGEECHNEWEITFEEVHRNGAIAYAIYNYIRYTGDQDYMRSHGLAVLIGIARFWAQRVHLSTRLGKYVMLGVTGPNEYENNVDNNWYTNYIARWCLQYTSKSIAWLKEKAPNQWSDIASKFSFRDEELSRWRDIIASMYLPKDDALGIYLQQDGYLNKEDITVADLSAADRPINQHWSWDRILRSPFIKQADVLQGFYFFEDHFTKDELRANYLYYEPRTVHESSLSPCVHSILAASLGMKEKAYEMYLRTARLDLDDYNNDTEDGCHITSMAGTWMSIVEGFAGMRIRDGYLAFDPFLPDQWKGYSFKINISISVRPSMIYFASLSEAQSIS